MMSWQVQDRDAMQKFMRESILQLCRINIGKPGSYEVDGIICITRGGRSEVESNTEDDQIVVKVHEQITTTVRDSVGAARPAASILREYLSSQGIPAQQIRRPADPATPLNLKRKAHDENDNAVIDIIGINSDHDSVASAKLLRSSNVNCFYDVDDRARLSKPFNLSVAKVHAGSTTNSETDNSKLELFSCGSCLLDFSTRAALEGHFQQSHVTCLEHYCHNCAVGFLDAADLEKHNYSIHSNKSVTAAVGNRRKQNKPRRGLMNSEESVSGHDEDDDADVIEDVWKPSKSPQVVTENETTSPSPLTVLHRQLLEKNSCEVGRNVAKQWQLDDCSSDMTSSEIVSKWRCAHCTACFADFSTFSVHCQAVHHRFPCPHCLHTFTQRVNRDRHLYNHTGERPYECAGCGDGFTRCDALRKHQMKCTASVNTSSDSNACGTLPLSDDDSDEAADTNNADCGLDLTMLSDQSRTLRELPKEPVIGNEPGTRSSIIDKQSVLKSFMQQKLSNSSAPHSPLPVVKNELPDFDKLVELPSSETSDRAVTQPTVTVSYQSPTEGRVYSCDICGTSTIGATAFEMHCRNEHRRTPCIYCGKTFSQKGNMERHQRQHTGERPFGCPHCSCSYTRKETLKVHINQAHPASLA